MNEVSFKRTWAEIDLDALADNFDTVRSRIKKGTKIMSVVKADAYGHGVENVARRLEEAGTDWFAVSSFDEGRQLRRLGITRPVLILGYTPPQLAGELGKYSLTQTVYSLSYAESLSAVAVEKGIGIDCHLKIDTGMGRIGFDAFSPESIAEMHSACSMKGLMFSGVFTHFPSADLDGDGDGTYTRGAFAAFLRCIEELKSRGICFSLRHCCNSAATIEYPDMQLDMVREGIVLYGLCPSDGVGGDTGLKPVMQLRTVVSMVKDVPPGRTVSYGRTYTTDKKTRVATVCIGYADGYQRCLSGRAYMLIRGKKAPIIGRICMDQLMLDVSEIPDVVPGDEATVFGKSENAFLPVDTLASLAGTINYEFVCMLGKRVPRVYFENGFPVSVTNYIDV